MSKLSELVESYNEIYSEHKQWQDRLSTISYRLTKEYEKIENNIFQSFIHAEIELQMQYHAHYYGYFVVRTAIVAGVLYEATVSVDVEKHVIVLFNSIVDKPSYLISVDL